MNAQRRKALEALAVKVEALEGQITALLSEVEDSRQLADDFAEEETEYWGNMPESLQNGEKGEAAQAAIQYIETARDALQELEDALGGVDLSDITGSIRSAGE